MSISEKIHASELKHIFQYIFNVSVRREEKIMDIKLSEIKLDVFNNCPGADRIKQYLYEKNLNPYIEIVDLNNDRFSWYQNAGDTLVIAINSGPTESTVALALGQLAVHECADEFHWKVVDKRFVVRIWWD